MTNPMKPREERAREAAEGIVERLRYSIMPGGLSGPATVEGVNLIQAAILKAESDAVRELVGECRILVGLLERMSEQQAMPDDSWIPFADHAKSLIETYSTENERKADE